MMSYFRLTVAFCCLILLLNKVTGQCSTLASLTASSTAASSLSNIPQPYTLNLLCEWRITSSSNSRIALTISSIYLEWNYDFLRIYDGSSLSDTKIYDSQSDRTPSNLIISTGNTLYLRFTTDYSVTYTGFDLSYIEVPALPSCDTTLSATSGVDQTAYYYYSYYGANCVITITASSSSNRIQYQVPVANGVNFDVVDGTFQSLQMGASVWISTGNSISFTVSSTNEVVILYQDVSNTAVGNLVTAASTVYNSICTNSGSSLSVTTSAQYLTSSNYPNSYNNNEYCYVTLTSSDSSKSIQLTISDWDVDYTDYMTIYDGPSTSYNILGISYITGSTLTSTAKSLHIVFSSGGNGVTRGFLLSYIQTNRVAPTCTSPVSFTSLTASTTSQTISSPNYPSDYNNNIDVYWLITKPTETDNLVLDITSMDIEDATSCRFDILSLYDGACNDNAVIASVCGSQAATYEDSTGLYVLVRFKTDSSVTRKGFSMTYSIGTFEDDEDADAFGEGNDWIIPLIVLMIIIALTIALGVGCCLHRRRVRLRKVKDHKTATTENKSRPKLAQKLTTHQLLHQFKKSYHAREAKKRIQPGSQQELHPSPNPPDENTTYLNRNQMTPHPSPQPAPPPPQFDPAYPPIGGNMPMGPINPAMPPGYSPSAPLFPPPSIPQGMIPPPFNYVTPAQAREMNQGQSQ